MDITQDEMIRKVFLLAVMKREKGESLQTTLELLVDTGMFNAKEGKAVLDILIKESYIVDDSLSMKGVMLAEEAEREFTLK
ncbi:hypothetical protein MNB_SV-15-388 [hydrothermal vent metagenome]|uniref:Uncharacterized protein n=1 Tax=hydrothermal vent metagenome TaxID=652676 RepID=A0A1W1EHG0_9ZZZZ